MNTLNRKSWGDLARHRTRTLLAAGTLAIAIASLGFLAVPGLLNAAMNRQVRQGRLNEVAISTRVTGLTPAQLGALGRLPGVAAVSADLSYVTTTTTTAGGTQNIVIDGGGLASATVNTVLLMSGRLPGRVRRSPTWPTARPPATPSRPAARSACGPPAARPCGCASAGPG